MGNENSSRDDNESKDDNENRDDERSDYYPKASPPYRDVNAYDAYTGKGITLTYGANNVIMNN